MYQNISFFLFNSLSNIPVREHSVFELIMYTIFLREIYIKNDCKFWMHAFVRNGRKSPEAAAGGNLALIKNGDIISPNVPNKSLHLQVSDE